MMGWKTLLQPGLPFHVAVGSGIEETPQPVERRGNLTDVDVSLDGRFTSTEYQNLPRQSRRVTNYEWRFTPCRQPAGSS